MASMLVRVDCLWKLNLCCREILLDCQEIFSDLIEGYVREFGLERAICTCDRMRGLSVVPTSSSYQALLQYLIGLNEKQLMYDVYVDTIKIGLRGNAEESSIHENVLRLLCIDGIVQESRDLTRKVLAFGIIPGNTIIDAICCGCCEKKDFDDILNFFAETRIAPGVLIGNKSYFHWEKVMVLSKQACSWRKWRSSISVLMKEPWGS